MSVKRLVVAEAASGVSPLLLSYPREMTGVLDASPATSPMRYRRVGADNWLLFKPTR